jgi:hypothetical protein
MAVMLRPELPDAVSRKMLKTNQGRRRDTGNRTVEWFRSVLICTFVALAHAPGTWAQPLLSDEARLSPSPLELLLEQREALQLTDEQVTRIETIRARLAGQNDPLIARLIRLRARWRAERQAGPLQDASRLRGIRGAAAPIHVRIQQNNRAAMQAVNRLLTPPQRARLRRIVEERRRQGEVRPPAEYGLDPDER